MSAGHIGGQCKRTNIGIALVSDPKVLFLDEPTSGLDSFTANEVMTVVKKLTQMGLTICATIHSPTPYCFNQFDRLHLLLRGQTVYFGPNGAGSALTHGDSPLPLQALLSVSGGERKSPFPPKAFLLIYQT